MKGVFTKPVAHIIPLVNGMDAKSLVSLSSDELTDVVYKCKETEGFTLYKNNPDVIVREIGSEWVLVPTGDFAQQFNGMISLNVFSHFVWQQFEQPNTLAEALRAAHEQFEDPHHMLDIQVRHLVQDYVRMGLFHMA